MTARFSFLPLKATLAALSPMLAPHASTFSLHVLAQGMQA
ncbi:glycoside hydrolase family 76 protein [Acetobacter orientalis]|uniref:Glycoside hydrolase family 76 protein n=1 Tax=Acetobacter orientalis TaxID=146474 RepID=A0A2Z5ZK11_9PROT|nr:glycoside hydrolase family 76 protein [Acetobacter orientalis]